MSFILFRRFFLLIFSLVLYSLSFQPYFCYNLASASVSPSMNFFNRLLISGGGQKKLGRGLMKKKKRFSPLPSPLYSSSASSASASSSFSSSTSFSPSSSHKPSSIFSNLISHPFLLYGGLLPSVTQASLSNQLSIDSSEEHEREKERERERIESFLGLVGDDQFHLLSNPLPLIGDNTLSFYICQVPGDGGCLFHTISIATLYQFARLNGTSSLQRFVENLPSPLVQSLVLKEKALSLSSHDSASLSLPASSSSSYGLNDFIFDLSYRLRLLACQTLESDSVLFLEGPEHGTQPSTTTHFYPLKTKSYPQPKIHEEKMNGNEKENDSEILASDLLLLSSQHYSLTPEKYLELMKKPQTWGGGPEIVSLLNHFKCPIYVYQLVVEDDSFKLQITAKFGHPFFKDREPIHLLCADGRFPNVLPGDQKEIGDHFLALFPCSSPYPPLRASPILCPDSLTLRSSEPL